MKRQHKKKDNLNVILNLRMTPEMFKKLDKLAWGMGVTMSQLMRNIIDAKLKEYE